MLCAALGCALLWTGCAAPLSTSAVVYGTARKQALDQAAKQAPAETSISDAPPQLPATPATPAIAATPAVAAGPVLVPTATLGGNVQLTAAVAPVSPVDPLVAAAPSQEMTLPEALQYAVTHHPRLQARKHEVDVARAKLIAAGVLPNPQLVLNYDSRLNDEDEGSSVAGRLMFTIPTADKLRLGKSVASAEICRAQYAFERESRVVLQEASTAGVDVLYFQELLGLQARLSELAAKQAAFQQGRFQSQQAPAADAIQAELAAKDIELRRLDTQAQLDNARVRLWRAIGMGTPELRGLKGRLVAEPLPAVPTTKLLAAAERNAPEINEARATLARSQRQLTLERAKAVPDLQIGPRTQNSIGGEERRQTLGGRIAFDLPLFDRNQGGICESAAQIDVDRALLEDAALTTLGDAAALYEELRSLQARLQYCESNVVPLADRTEATIRENEVNRAMPPNQAAGLLLDVVKMRALHLQLRYRYATLHRQLENLLGCRLVELQDKP
jgi:cobalt-zinc-cadmium efflux system outer membrane protein